MAVDLTPHEGVRAPRAAEEDPEFLHAQDVADTESEKLRAAETEAARISQEKRTDSLRRASEVEKQLRLLFAGSGVRLVVRRSEARPRKNANEGWMGTLELDELSRDIEDELSERWGGGKYRIEVKDNQNNTLQNFAMSLTIAGKSKAKEDDTADEERPGVASELKELLPLMDRGPDMSAIAEMFKSTLETIGRKDDGNGLKEVLEAMREDRRAAEERAARAEEARSKQFRFMVSQAITLAPALGAALSGMLTRRNEAAEVMLKTIPSIMESQTKLQASATNMLMRRFVDVLGQTAQNDEESGIVGKISQMVGLLGSPGIANIGQLLTRAAKPQPPAAAGPAAGSLPPPPRTAEMNLLEDGEHESMPLGAAPPATRLPAPAPAAPATPADPAQDLLDRIRPENAQLLRRSRVDQFIGAVILESRAGSDPAGAAGTAHEFYRLLPRPVLQVIEETEEIGDLAKVFAVLQTEASPKVIEALSDEVQHAEDPEERLNWLWDVLGELLAMAEEGDQEEGEEEGGEEGEEEHGEEEEEESANDGEEEDEPLPSMLQPVGGTE